MNIDLFGNIIQEEEDFSLEKPSKPSPFSYTDNIAKKRYPTDFSGYSPFLFNLQMSQRDDLVVYANEMNKYHNLPEKAQFDFYFHALPKKNLFAKWSKASKSKNWELIAEYFGVSMKVAKDYDRVLNKEQIKAIKDDLDGRKGGR